MPLRERLTDVSRARHWDQELPLTYAYTLGKSGQKFVEGLKKGLIYASECTNCSTRFLPPKAYCTKCFHRIEKYVEVPKEGKIAGLTHSGKQTYCYVTFPRFKGGLVHRLLKEANIGSNVIPAFAPPKERKGTIADLMGFVPK